MHLVVCGLFFISLGLLVSAFSQSIIDVIFLTSLFSNIPSYLAGIVYQVYIMEGVGVSVLM